MAAELCENSTQEIDNPLESLSDFVLLQIFTFLDNKDFTARKEQQEPSPQQERPAVQRKKHKKGILRSNIARKRKTATAAPRVPMTMRSDRIVAAWVCRKWRSVCLRISEMWRGCVLVVKGNKHYSWLSSSSADKNSASAVAFPTSPLLHYTNFVVSCNIPAVRFISKHPLTMANVTKMRVLDNTNDSVYYNNKYTEIWQSFMNAIKATANKLADLELHCEAINDNIIASVPPSVRNLIAFQHEGVVTLLANGVWRSR